MTEPVRLQKNFPDVTTVVKQKQRLRICDVHKVMNARNKLPLSYPLRLMKQKTFLC